MYLKPLNPFGNGSSLVPEERESTMGNVGFSVVRTHNQLKNYQVNG